ncbi:MAG: hypothetical protein OXD01_11465, partial [Gammaproteobacteria bacterium]|nr:hypothetical protein [Gammaproteobacteria bacterium]
ALSISYCGWSRSSTIDHVSSSPPKIPYARFSRVRLQVAGTFQLRYSLPSMQYRLRLTQPYHSLRRRLPYP